MAIKIVHPSHRIQGEIHLTSSKSISNRVLIIKALAEDEFEVLNLAEAKDTKILKQLIQDFSIGKNSFNVGHAGTVMRFFTAFLALKQKNCEITGSERMQERPIQILVDALNHLGGEISYLNNENYPPLSIRSSDLTGSHVAMDGSVSSQYISALLLIAPYLPNGLKISFTSELVSRPYINMTIHIMKYFGVVAVWGDDGSLSVSPGTYKSKSFFVEGDWSSASYWYGMAALSQNFEVTLTGLKKDSLQGDSEVVNIYQKFGVTTEFQENGIKIFKDNNVTLPEFFEFDFESCPDIAQTVAVTCAALNIEAKFTGLKTLRIKETDRIAALKHELNCLGFIVEVQGDDMMIKKVGKVELLPHSVKTYDDHRMALAFAPLALIALVQIKDEHVVEKSYPNYWDDLKNVGFSVEEF